MSQLLNVGIAGFGYSSHVFHVPFLKEDPRFHILIRHAERSICRYSLST